MINASPLRVLVVDDTVVYRKIVSDVLTELPGVEVVATAHNGKIAMSRIATQKIDLLILDIEMPEMSGLDVLAELKKSGQDVGAIVLSTLTHQGGEMTMKALELGAFDFMPKPQAGSMEDNKKEIKKTLSSLIKAFGRRKEIQSLLKGKAQFIHTTVNQNTNSGINQRIQQMNRPQDRVKSKSEIVGIGISTGGPNALAQMMPKLPSNLGVPLLVVQHMPPVFTQSLADSLDTKCALKVKEAKDGEQIKINTAYIAPGGKQMKVVAGVDGKNRILRITNDPPENSCKPSVDYLFRSVAHHYVGRATGVIMTGMGSDGTVGLKLMKRNGATIIAQDEATCVVYGMPKEPAKAGIVDVIAPLDQIADEIRRTVC